MLFTIILLALAAFLAIPVFSGKGKLLTTENIKKGKEKTYVKALRIIYLCLFVIVLLMAALNFVENVAYTTTYYYEFVDDYTDVNGEQHAAGEEYPAAEMAQMVPQESATSLCAPAENVERPYRYTRTDHDLNPKYSFLSFIPYETARVLNFVTLGISLVIIFIMFVFINKMTDKEAQKKAQASSVVRPSMPKGAFDFSDYKDEVEVKDDMFDGVTQEIPSKK